MGKTAEQIIKEAMKFDGLSRVLLNEHEAVSPRRALEMGSSDPVIAFMRGDGWSLGAPYGLEYDAYKLWRDEWTHFTEDFKNWKPIKQYRGAK